MNGGEVVFHFKGDDKDLNKKTSELGSKLGNIGKSVGGAFLKGTAVATTAITGLIATSVKGFSEMEQLSGGAKKIFDEMDYSTIEKDATEAYKSMNMSAQEYLTAMNNVGATFASTMGDQKGYDTAKKGLQAISDYATGTGADINLLSEKYKMITRSTSSYLSIADQFAGLLPQTTDGFLKQAQASGFLSSEYKKLTDVPVDEYQQAITNMLEQGVDKMGLLGNTSAEAEKTISGSFLATKSALSNFISGAGSIDEVVSSMTNLGNNVVKAIVEMAPKIVEGLIQMTNALIPQIPSLIEKLLPTVINGATSLLNGLIKALPQIFQAIVGILPQLTQTLLSMLPTILQVLIQMLIMSIQAVAQMLPTLIPQIVDAILQMIPILIDNLPLFIKAGFQLIAGLIEGLYKALPVLLSSLPKIGSSMINYWKQLPSMFKDIGGMLIRGLWNGISNFDEWIIGKILEMGSFLKTWLTAKSTELGANLRLFLQQLPSELGNTIGQLLGHIANFGISVKNWLQTELPKILTSIKEWLKQLPSNLWNTLVDMKNKAWNGIQDVAMQIRNGLVQLPGNMLNIGKNIVIGLWNGIKNVKAWLTEKIKSFASGVISGFKKTFGIHSPSKEFAIIGRFNMLGLEKGMDDMQPKVQQAIDGMFDLSPSLYGSASTNLSPQVNVINNINMKQDPLGQMVNDVKTFSGGAKNDYNYGMA